MEWLLSVKIYKQMTTFDKINVNLGLCQAFLVGLLVGVMLLWGVLNLPKNAQKSDPTKQLGLEIQTQSIEISIDGQVSYEQVLPGNTIEVIINNGKLLGLKSSNIQANKECEFYGTN